MPEIIVGVTVPKCTRITLGEHIIFIIIIIIIIIIACVRRKSWLQAEN